MPIRRVLVLALLLTACTETLQRPRQATTPLPPQCTRPPLQRHTPSVSGVRGAGDDRGAQGHRRRGRLGPGAFG